jgi:DNA-binding MarR family transcriptional regulator
MSLKKLTKNEKDTLWGLVNHPTLNDRALAKKTRLKLSTVTAIRRRLREKDYFWTVNIPNFSRLGLELLCVEYGVFNEAVPLERRKKYFTEFVSEEPSAVFAVMSRSNGVVFCIAHNYSQATTMMEKMEIFFMSHHLIEEDAWKRAIFPFSTSRFWNFFSFSPVLRYVHSMKKKPKIPEFAKSRKAGISKLSKKEKRVMYGLVKYPEESDSAIADRFDISRQAVSNIKKRFVKDDLLSTQRILNFEKMGCELLTFSYTFFGPKTPLESRKGGIDYVMSVFPAFMGISSNFENVLFGAVREYPEYDSMRENLLSFYKSHLSIARPPEVLLFPVKDICHCKKPTFHSLLEPIFEIEEE